MKKELTRDAHGLTELSQALAEIQAAHVDAGEHRRGEFNDPTFRRFLEELILTASAKGWLRLAVLSVNDVAVAYNLAFLYQGRYYGYNTAHRADSQRFGAGKLLMLYVLEQFFAEGGGVIDYLRGTEAYKERWTEHQMDNVRVRASRRKMGGLLGRLLWFYVMPRLRDRAPALYSGLITASTHGLKGFAGRIFKRSNAPRRSP